MSGQNVPAWLYGQAGTFCPNKMSHDKTSPFGYIGKRRHFVRGHFVLGIFCLGDILSWGHFVLGTFCLVDILSCGHFVLGDILSGDVLSWGHFVLGTICHGDNLLRGHFVWGHYVLRDIFYMGTFCTLGHFVLSPCPTRAGSRSCVLPQRAVLSRRQVPCRHCQVPFAFQKTVGHALRECVL